MVYVLFISSHQVLPILWANELHRRLGRGQQWIGRAFFVWNNLLPLFKLHTYTLPCIFCQSISRLKNFPWFVFMLAKTVVVGKTGVTWYKFARARFQERRQMSNLQRLAFVDIASNLRSFQCYAVIYCHIQVSQILTCTKLPHTVCIHWCTKMPRCTLYHIRTSFCKNIWATSWENLFMPYANNKGADQPAHARSLISTFVVRCLDSMICILAKSKVSNRS